MLFSNSFMSLKKWSAAAMLIAFSASSLTAEAQVLLRDDFDGTGNVDSTVWRLPFGSEGSFVGRTQYRGDAAVDLPQQGIAAVGATDNAVAELHLDSYSVIDPGNAFLGHDLLTKGNFALGGGLSFEGRMRLDPASDALAGTVGGLFLFDVQGDTPPGSGTFFRDEIDFELIGNQASGAMPSQDIATNYWNDGTFDNGGDLEFHDVAGLDLTQFQDYRVDWTPQSIKWYVNDNLVRTQTTDVPDDPQKLHLNLWAPDTSFSDAFNAALQPTAVEANNQRTTLQVDHVEVSRFNTTTSANLLTDGSFEGDLPTPIQNVPTTTTGEWLSFGNVSFEADDISGLDPGVPDMAPDGIFMAKMFGPFSGGPDASGVLQNVVASPGQTFEASLLSLTPGADSIAGNENFTALAISFLDASGNEIQEAFADPGNIVDTNGVEFPLLDGRDVNMPEDVFVKGTASAIAPAGTAYARMSVFFIQIANEGGAAWYDDAQLRLLEAIPLAGLDGDYNADGVVDAADYTVYRDNLGLDSSALNGNGSGSATVVAADYNLWVANYGTSLSVSTSAAVPEPSSLALLATMALFAQRKRVR